MLLLLLQSQIIKNVNPVVNKGCPQSLHSTFKMQMSQTSVYYAWNENWLERNKKSKGTVGGGLGEGVSVKCERSYISLISHPSSSNLLIKQVLQEVKRCVSKPHEDRSGAVHNFTLWSIEINPLTVSKRLFCFSFDFICQFHCYLCNVYFHEAQYHNVRYQIHIFTHG